MRYAELHCLSNFSFLRGASHPEELVAQAASLGYQAIAITDECSVAGVVRAHNQAKSCNMHLIVGSEFYTTDGFHLVVLTPCRVAYGELCELITRARRRCEKGFYQVSLKDFSEIIHHGFVLWCISGDETEEQLTDMVQWLSNHFGQRFWLRLKRDLGAFDKKHYSDMLAWLNRHQVPAICASEALMHCKQRKPLQDTLTAIRIGQPVSQIVEHLRPNAEDCLHSLTILNQLYDDGLIRTTIDIAKRCQFNLDSLRYEYPSELVPDNLTATTYLRLLVEKGQKWRFGDYTPLPIQAILAKELKLIQEMQYEYFFLTIYDIVEFARRQQILFQGRGSAANSVVCYCLGITEVDPRKVEVLFERFISKKRGEPPDIDVDFEHERREEVIQYIYTKYGRDRAALAATVITYRFKSAVRDVGKALGFEQSRLERLISQVDRRDKTQDWHDQLGASGLQSEADLVQYFAMLVEQIKGFPRHLSQHVGGFVISAGPLHELVPVENASMANRTVIQWDKDDLESLGLLKVDVLALGMLSAIRKCFQLIHYHRSIDMGMHKVQWEQPAVYDMLCRADTMGVFQVESRAQSNMLPRLRPRCFYDLVIQIAIVRPGPIQGDMVHPFLRRRDGKETISYPNNEVKAVLSRTLGVPIFQEQVIKLAMVAAGFSAGEADQLRRAMASWKKHGELDKFEQKLVVGMKENGYTEKFAQQVFNQIKGFGEYGFPESHSASFALLAYVSAWLKLHYPAEFCCALLNSQPMGFYSPSQLIQDAKRHGVEVLSVDVNESNWHHTLGGDSSTLAIRLGMRLVKGLGQESGLKIEKERKQGRFTAMQDLHDRLSLASDQYEALASAGALSSISGHRYQARWDMLSIEPERPLLADAVSDCKPVTLYGPSEADNLFEDYGSLGLTLSRHPLALLREQYPLHQHARSDLLVKLRSKQVVRIIGIVVGRQRPGTASGVTFMTLEDEAGYINVIVWQNTARQQRLPYLKSTLLEVHGVVEIEQGIVHVIAGKLIDRSNWFEQLQVASRDFH